MYYARIPSLLLALRRFLGLPWVVAGLDALSELKGWSLVLEGFPPLDFPLLRRRTRAQTDSVALAKGGVESVIVEEICIEEIPGDKP